MSELRGIYIDTRIPPFPSTSQGLDKISSSGISSASGSISSNNNNSDLPRKRNQSPDVSYLQCDSPPQLMDDYEMEKIRCFMAHVDGDRRASGVPNSHRGSIEPSLMSTVFAVVLVIIVSFSVYAFASLFRAVIKRMNP